MLYSRQKKKFSKDHLEPNHSGKMTNEEVCKFGGFCFYGFLIGWLGLFGVWLCFCFFNKKPLLHLRYGQNQELDLGCQLKYCTIEL